jgi:16S rRNA (cytosine967-C5)-methyltransferase
MTPAARVSAAIEILDAVLDGARAETALTRWGRVNRYAGSKDRAAIRDHVFDALRQRDSALSRVGGARTGRSLMLGILHLQGVDLDAIFNDARYAPVPLSADEGRFKTPTTDWLNCDISEWLWPHWCHSLGDQAISIAKVLQQRAPVFLRVNLLKATVDQACASLSEAGYDVSPHPEVSTALRVTGRTAGLQATEAFLNGLIELQDASSQASVALLDPKHHGLVLDYCAGGGGKSLALAAWLGGSVHAHDVNLRRMVDLPARAERANAAISIRTKDQFAPEYGVVFCDVPCSGSGSWRRDPEGKWALTQDQLDALITTQREILSDVAKLVAPDGRLVYATCSVLTCENQDQIDWFTAQNPTWRVEIQNQWIPSVHGDGFFASVLAQP